MSIEVLTCLMRTLFVEQTQSQGFSEPFQVKENRVCCGIPPEGSLSIRQVSPRGRVFVFHSFFDGGKKNETQKAKITEIEAQLRSLR